MKSQASRLIIAFTTLALCNAAAVGNAEGPPVVPAPQKFDHREGSLVLTPRSRIVASNEKLAPLAKLLAEEVELLTSIRLTSAADAPRPGDIVLANDPTLQGEEHSIVVGDTAAIAGGNADAVALGTVTILQAMAKVGAGIEIPRMIVSDKPAVAYRGLMLDVAREPHTLETLKQAVVLCRWYKLRYLQLHLTDNESFTFPTTAYPQLRSADINRQGERHFSLAELRELEAYANARGVAVVPEVELPGHGMAMLRGMPDVFGPGGNNRQAICVGREKVYEVLDTLVGEICDVFRTTPYFHIGADEVNYDDWKDCQDTKAYMTLHNIDNTVELYRHFLVRMNEIVKRHGKRTIVWEGFHKEGRTPIPRDITVMVYECKFNLPPDLIADGYQVINAAWQPLYVTSGHNWPPHHIYGWNLYRWENWWDQSKAFPTGIDVAPTPQVIGAQMVTWSLPDDQEIPALRERLAAMSERVWNPGAGRTFADFTARFRTSDAQLSRLLSGAAGATVNPALDPAKPDGGNAEWRMRHGERAAEVKKNADAPGIWEMGPFEKRDQPVLSPNPEAKFQCPILGTEVRWEEQNVYNPAAVVKDGKVYLLYRADDKNPDIKWGRTCRIGLASSEDGINFTRHPTPVLYPDNDEWKNYEWEGGCEDLHVVEGEDGTYYMNYTTWNGGSDTMSVATSRDLIHWTKHGPAFRKGTPDNIGGRSGVVITRLAGERLLAAKIDGKYWMYYTHPCALAWSDNLIDWTRADQSVWGGGHEAGAIALLRDNDILLMFNTQGFGNGWTLGQALIDRTNMTSALKESNKPFLYPELEWEKKGFTEPATVANTLVPFKGRWLLYYGAADRCIGLATCPNPNASGCAPAAKPGPATIHWRPAAPGVFGDPNPFFWKGEYHVFYLLPDKGSYVWEHIVTKDLVHWQELPRALEHGNKGEPDEWNAASGSVVEKDGTFHIFYVGFNSGHPNGRQQVMHATSPDLIKWTKHPEDTFVGDGVTYWSKAKSPPPQGDPDESFRDPYVWWNDQDQRWWMAMVTKDAKTHRYVLGRCISTDLVHWQQVTPFQSIRGDDCPDIFQSGGRWFCIRNISYYSSSESLLGPYQPDEVLRYDTEHLCVAKRMWDGRRHVGVGWVRDLIGNRDAGEFGWGGNQSIPREFFAGPEGLLCTRPVPEVTALFTQTLLDNIPDKPQSVLGVPADFMLKAGFQLDPDATLVVGFRRQPDKPASGYRLTIRPKNQEIEIAGSRYVYARRCPLDASKPIQVQAFVDGSIIECFVNDAYAFTMRGYDFPEGNLSLEVSNGSMRILELKVKTRPPGN